MKSIGTFKRMATQLRKQIENAKNAVVNCEIACSGNPCTRTARALDKAAEKLLILEGRLDNVNDIVNNYEFYAYCWEQEENEALSRSLYLQY